MSESSDTSTSEATETGGTGGSTTSDGASFVEGSDRVSVTADETADPRTYSMESTHPQRDGGPSSRVVVEEADGPVLRSGSLLFDALFAMAVDDARLNSVEAIRDGAFQEGAPQPCRCFQTGELWTYVWTRDTAYAVDLGLAWLDPQRSADSLRFKLSEAKPDAVVTGPQVVQDTGTGGSWPVSTDRVVWALGAAETLRWLPEPERSTFAAEALEALANTVELDRQVAWDAEDGLYRGEQSFLDWREQSYPSWTADDVVHIGMSKALSTNVGHLAALRLAADLAGEVDDDSAHERYTDWADALQVAIDHELWLEEHGSWSSLVTTTLDPTRLARWDWLGTALAVLHLERPDHAERAVATYPQGAHGPPVLAPQQPDVPIYHNRAIWPFVTAYGVRAARAVANDSVFDRGAHSLIRGAALNLSNMENFEVSTGANWVDDGDLSGPVVNSRRQLWSVAGYLSLVTQGIFGISATPEGLRVEPFVTRGLRRAWLSHSDRLELRRFPARGASIGIVVELPPVTSEGGHYSLDAVRVDGELVEGPIPWDVLVEGSEVVVTLTAGPTAEGALTELLGEAGPAEMFAPREPSLHGVSADPKGVRLALDAAGESDVVLHVYRDGQRVAAALPVETTSWVDTDAAEGVSHCYAVESERVGSGHRSQHSPPQCWWGEQGQRVQVLSAWRLEAVGGSWSEEVEPHSDSWGAPDDMLIAHGFQPSHTGPHWLQLRGANGAGALNTGITAAHKRVQVEEASSGRIVAEGSVVVPHTGAWDRYLDSSLMVAELDAEQTYTLRVVDAPNMAALSHFIGYTGGVGGGLETSSFVNVSALKVLTRESTGAASPPAFVLDGGDDLSVLPEASRVVPGAPLADWSTFALAWDERNLYLAVVSPAFEDDFVPFVLYVEADPGPAVPGVGLEYSGLTPSLSFTPTHAVTLRAAAGEEGWPGVWLAEGEAFRQLMRFEEGKDRFLAADRRTLSAVIPWGVLGQPSAVRVAGHVVWGVPGSEWKALIPSNHTPWVPSESGALTIDRSGPLDSSAWGVE